MNIDIYIYILYIDIYCIPSYLWRYILNKVVVFNSVVMLLLDGKMNKSHLIRYLI